MESHGLPAGIRQFTEPPSLKEAAPCAQNFGSDVELYAMKRTPDVESGGIVSPL